jgi:hypothetical protein
MHVLETSKTGSITAREVLRLLLPEHTRDPERRKKKMRRKKGK